VSSSMRKRPDTVAYVWVDGAERVQLSADTILIFGAAGEGC
jgi:hypothetical protein